MSEILFEVNGVSFKKNTLYEIRPKKDDNAPEAFIKHNTTKLLVNGISQGAPCIFRNKVWDTGFYEDSPCYFGHDKDKVKDLVSKLNKYIVKPYKDQYGIELSHIDKPDSFWLSFGASNLYTGRMLNTEKVDELLELYIAVLHKHVATKEQENNPMYLRASYTVVDKAEVVEVSQERAKNRVKALTKFMSLHDSKKSIAEQVLNYIGLPSMSDSMIETVIDDYVRDPKQGHNNAVRLIEVINKTESPRGIAELNMYGNLSILLKSGKLQKTNQRYYFDGEELGTDLKRIAANMATTKKDDPIKSKMLAQLQETND